MVIFHHNDADGFAAAYLLKKFHNITDNTRVKVCRHDKPTDISFVNTNEVVYIVDYSFSIEQIKELLAITKRVIWIDHHISAINKYAEDDLVNTIPGLRSPTVAGCMLTYIWIKHFQGKLKAYNFGDITKEENLRYNDAPWWLQYIADYDAWRHELPFTHEFNLGLKQHSVDFPTFEKLDKGIISVPDIIKAGEVIRSYSDEVARSTLLSYGFKCELPNFPELKVFAVNSPRANSEFFKSIHTEYDAFVAFVWANGKFTYGIYSVNNITDCSKIAASFGGGGHFGAAGWTSSNFELKMLA